MSDFFFELLKWFIPIIGAWILAQIPAVQSWAKHNWTKSVIAMTVIASFSLMGLSFYTYYRFIKPYIIVCDTANNCISVSVAELKTLETASDNTMTEIGRIYTDGQGYRRDMHINFARDWAKNTNDSVKAITLRIKID